MNRTPGRARLCRAKRRTARRSLALPISEPDLRGFTLIELLVVIIIISVLIGIAFPVFSTIQNQAKKAQAKNDVTQIVTAVNAFYTEYGKYPVASTTNDTFFGRATDAVPAGSTNGGENDVLIDVLRNNTAAPNNSATVASLNPRGIVYLDLRAVANNSAPKAGIIPNGAAGLPAGARIGVFYDPWGSEYRVLIDTAYNNSLTNPYSDSPGGANITTGVVSWSLGKNGVLGGGAAAAGFSKEPGSANNYVSSGDVISWQ